MLPMMWFTGVIEDRMDPLELGRVKVRIFGLHTDDVSKISTNDLPWSHVMMPVNSASISGVGITPTGLVEGSWVVGFFADGENAQDPIIMGSLPGKHTQTVDELKAFKNFNGAYPRWYNETDVSKVARDTWKDHASYATRYVSRVTGVEKSTKANLNTVAINPEEETRGTWDEPEPRDGIGGLYPYVHTYETETGIVKEYDDTPNASRIHEFHPAGTFYEIYPDGKKVTKVVGDNYEIIIKNDNVLIRGSSNITIEGDCRQLVKGDYTLEVGGDYNLKVHGNRNTKITQNDLMEIIGSSNTNVAETYTLRVAKDQTIVVDRDRVDNVGGNVNHNVTGTVDYTFLDTLTIFSNGEQSVSTNSSQQFLSKSGLEFGSQSDWILRCNANLSIDVVGNFTTHSQGALAFTSDSTSSITSTGAFGISASRIDLN
jgi:hypothetical protein